MKILFVSSMYYKPGGTYAGQAIHRQAVELHRAGVEVRVICPVPRFERRSSLLPRRSVLDARALNAGTKDVDGVPVTYLPFPNIPLGVSPGAHALVLHHYLSKAVLDLTRTFSFDLLHAHRLFPTGYVALKIARRLGVPGIVSAVGSDVHTHPRRNHGIRRRTVVTITGGDMIMAVSQALASEVEGLARTDRPVRVVYRGVDTDQFAPRSSSGESRRRLKLPQRGAGVCTVCRLVDKKGVLDVLGAFADLAVDFPDAWLAVVGDGPLRAELRSAVQSRSLEDRVFLPGARPHAEIPEWLNAADVFVLASYNEGLPNVVREAMACGRPVVANAVGGVPEVVEDGVTGILVSPGSVVELGAAVRRLLRSPSIRLEMGTAGRDLVRSKFSWSSSTEALQATYRDALRDRAVATRAASE